MKLVFWLALCLLACLLLRRRPDIAVALGLGVWVAVPGVSSGLITGHSSGPLGMHAGTWLLLIAFLVQVMNDPVALLETMARRFIAFTGILLVLAAAVLQTKTGSAERGVVLALNEMAAPFLAFWLLTTVFDRRPSAIAVIRGTIIGLAVAESVYAVVQYTVGSVVLYRSDYEKQYWWVHLGSRWMGTTDHPLVLSVLVCAAIPLLVGMRRRWLQAPLLVLLLVGVVITQSRSGAAAAAVGAIYVVWASRSSAVRKITLTTVMGIAGAIVATSSLSTGIVDRIQNDTGSTLARGSAYTYFADNWTHYIWAGGGLTSNYQVAADAGLDTSFENAFIMYSIDLGLLMTIAYFGFMLAFAFHGRRGRVPGARMSALVVLVLCQTFNSLEVSSLVGPLLWIVIALSTTSTAAAASTDTDAEDAQQVEPPGHDLPPAYRSATIRRTSASV